MVFLVYSYPQCVIICFIYVAKGLYENFRYYRAKSDIQLRLKSPVKMHPTLAFFIELLDALAQKKIVMASLRYKPLEERVAFSGDYDFVTSQENIDAILQVLFDLATASQCNFVINRVKYGKVVISLFGQTDTNPIVIEIWTYLEVRFEQTLNYLFWEDVKAHLIEDPKMGYALSKEFEALYYISHLKTKKKDLTLPLIRERLAFYIDVLKEDYPEYMEWYRTLAADSARLKEIGTKANSALVERGILFTAQDREKAKMAKQLRRKISLHRVYSQLLRRLKITPVVGPDGVGKTSIIEALKKRSRSRIKYYRFKNLFRHNFLYQLSFPFLKRKLNAEVAKNQYDDLYGEWLVTIASLRFPLLALVTFLGKRFYFSDRFFHDLILKDTRFLDRKAVLRENWKALIKKSPRTFWFLQLDAPAEVILSRKQELNADAIRCYRKEVFRMYLEKPSRIYSYINTDNSIEVCGDVLMKTARNSGIKAK